MTTITNKKQYPSEQYLNELITNIEFAARAPVEVVRAMAAELQKRREADSAEPVAYIFKHPAGKLFWALTDESNKEQPDVIPVYADSPAPVVPDEIDVNDVPRAVTYFKTHRDCYADGWNACRAAMLQSGNFRENKNSSTNNFREIAETSTNYPVIPSKVLSAILKVAKIRADFDDFDGDRRGIGDCLDEAEQELIVTINKYASQLAAEPIATNDVREQTAVPPVPVIQADIAQAIEKLKRKLVECNRYNYCADAVKGVEYACHAAMLQGSQPVSQSKTYRLDFGQWLEQQRGKIDVDCGCVSTETFMHWLRVAYEAGNYPDIPDSSVPAPGKGVTGERIRIKPHVYRELVNRLHDTAIKCAGTQQLRERISRVLGDVITPYHHKQAEKSGLERCHLEAALNIKPGHTLGIIDALLVHKMARALLSLVDAGDTSEGEV